MFCSLHERLNERVPNKETDMAGGYFAPADEDVTSDIEKKDSDVTPDGEEPTELEKKTLRRVGENLPASAFLIAIVELTERFAYYGSQGLFQNYIKNSPDGSDGPAGIGLGEQAATGLNLFFQFFSYCKFCAADGDGNNSRLHSSCPLACRLTSTPVTPILGAIISDQYLGKYKTILLFAGIYWCGLLILFLTALPFTSHDSKIGGYITAIIIIGLGTGGIKSNIAPLIADQYQRVRMAIRTESSGERVVIDPAVTYQRIYMIFYWCINLGALSLMATPFMEKYEGFWTAYLMCFCMFNVGITILVLRRKSYVIRPPRGSVITDAFKAIGLMITARDMDAPKPSWRNANGKAKAVNWDDHFIDELKRGLRACNIFIFYPIFWVSYGQFSTNFVTQAGQMEGHGMPNDFMQNFDPLSILIFTPILDRLVYPPLRRMGVELRPIARITIGFIFASMCLAYAAIVQHLVYNAGPCYDDPLDCAAAQVEGGKSLPNHVHIAVQTPAYVFMGVSEIFISVTGLEYAYTKAPPSMKSFVQSLYLVTNSIGAALGIALTSVSTDPKYIWLFTGISATAFITAIAFYAIYHRYDAEEDKMYDLDRDQPVLGLDGKPVNQTESDETADGANAHHNNTHIDTPAAIPEGNESASGNQTGGNEAQTANENTGEIKAESGKK